ncbi:penicillin-binding transpeptidase domain-containing protein [Georgenia muralis]|uniref:penicillin-binding transpeptidase domain-containing protein n=1 Tax=Georgenia muralis TaxID=154117 RepID=UPI001FE9FD9D|nr:penicillin-binding transpeptidase domain-containing protein [Georgenia muralis]
MAVVLLSAGLAACTSGPPSADGAAEDLAAALQSGDLTAAPLASEGRETAPAEAAEVLGAVGDLPRQVEATVGGVDDSGESPVVPVELVWTVDVDSTPADLTWTTTAELMYDGESWLVPWARTLVHPGGDDGGVLDLSRTPAARGTVLGAGGVEIVTEREVLRIGVDKANTADPAAAALALAEILGFDDPQGYADRVAAAGERAFVEAIVVRRFDHGDLDVEAGLAVPGVLGVEGTLPLAPTAGFARPVLGTVGAATAEIVEESDGAVRAGDVVGLSGLQRRYDDALRGEPGTTVVLRHGDGTTEELFESEPQPGADVTTTLDPELQMVAEGILEPVSSASALVAVRPSTGEVLVAASGPGSAGLSTATLGTYPPGSTFKVATALALLRSGLAPTDALECPATVVADGREFPNYPGFPDDGLGATTLERAIATSCNTALIGVRDRVSAGDLAAAAASLGLGVPVDVGVPVVVGDVPAEQEGTELAAAMIGQGRVTASPLAMATVAASVAASARVSPVLVTDVGGEPPAASEGDRDGGGDDSAGSGEEAAEPAPITEAEAAALRAMMRAVVLEGTGTGLAGVPGEVHAKTGTAEYGETGDTREHAWTIAFRDDLAVAVFVEEGVSGADTAVPLVAQFFASAP